jgi:hypothetical protein
MLDKCQKTWKMIIRGHVTSISSLGTGVLGMARIFWTMSVVALAVAAVPLEMSAATLSQAQKELIARQVVAAERLGNPAGVLRAISPLVAKLTDEQLLEAGAFLREQACTSQLRGERYELQQGTATVEVFPR